MKLTPLLNELIVQDLSDTSKDKKLFVVWKNKLFLFNDDSDISPIVNFIEDHPAFDKKLGFNAETVYDLISYVAEMPPDIISGEYSTKDKSLWLSGYDKGNPLTSTILKKVAKQLKIKKIGRSSPGMDDDEDSETHHRNKFKGQIPKIVYHGTNTENLIGILQNGIMASQDGGNFTANKVWNYDSIFFAASFKDAQYYAQHSLFDADSRSLKKAYPVILELVVPDPTKIIPDFDADTHYTGKRHYSHSDDDRHKVGASDMKPMTTSKEMGKFGYNGTIGPQHIKWIYVWSAAMKKWRKYKPSTIKRGLNYHGIDWWWTQGIGDI
jgi:hypothetical protein